MLNFINYVKIKKECCQMFKRLVSTILIFFIFVVVQLFEGDTALGDTFQAGAYLETVQNSDGSWGSDHSTIYFETTEAVKTLRLLGRTGFAYQRGINFVARYELSGVEDRARRIDAVEPAGTDTTQDVNTLFSTQNSDGGWGFDLDYGSNVYHTALALCALDTAGISDPTVIGNAVNYLASQQYPDGSFGLAQDSKSIYLTSVIVLTLKKVNGPEAAIDAAVQWLLTKQNPDGGFGEPSSTIFETSYASMVLYTVEPSLQASRDTLGYLIVGQEANGSFNDDIYQTAVGAQGLRAGIIDTRLYAGLNLFGYDVEVPTGYTSHTMIADLGSQDEVEMIQRYDPATGTVQTTAYEGGVVVGDEFDIVSGEGYYVFMKQEKTASQIRPVVTFLAQLQPGLNLVSIPCVSTCNSYDMLSYLGTPGEVSSIQRFNPETGGFQTTAYLGDQPSGVNFDIVNGEAYLIYMRVAKEIDFPMQIVEVDYEIAQGGSVTDSRNFQGDPALLDQAAYYTENQIEVPDFITYSTTGVSRVSATEIQIDYIIQVSPTAPEGVFEFQVQYGLLDVDQNPLEPLTNNLFQFRIRVLP
jgi:hypothetical protein